jgi:hypothetical protein
MNASAPEPDTSLITALAGAVGAMTDAREISDGERGALAIYTSVLTIDIVDPADFWTIFDTPETRVETLAYVDGAISKLVALMVAGRVANMGRAAGGITP